MSFRQTKGYVNLKGKISGLNSDKAYRNEGAIEKLTFFIRTSEHNSIPVSITQFKSQIGKDVYASKRDEEGSFETKKFPWAKRFELGDFKVIGVNCRGKDESEVRALTKHDAIQYVRNKFTDGDMVYVNAEINRNKSGDRTFTNYEVTSIYHSDDEIDEENEISHFKETFIFNQGQEASKNYIVEGFTVDWRKEPTPVTYTIDKAVDEDITLINYIKNDVKFGDVVTAEGVVHNRVEGEWVETSSTDGKIIGRGVSSFEKPSNSFVVTGERKDTQILGISDIQKGLYSKADFEQTNDVGETANANDNPLNDDDNMPDWLFQS